MLRRLQAQRLANMAWACATPALSDALLLGALARKVERSFGDLNAQELANTTWAYATAAQSDVASFAISARIVKRRFGEFNPQ